MLSLMCIVILTYFFIIVKKINSHSDLNQISEFNVKGNLNKMYEFDSCTTKQIEIIQSQYLFSF
jgi:hypothetical protein